MLLGQAALFHSATTRDAFAAASLDAPSSAPLPSVVSTGREARPAAPPPLHLAASASCRVHASSSDSVEWVIVQFRRIYTHAYVQLFEFQASFTFAIAAVGERLQLC